MNEQNKHAALTIAQQYPPAQYNLLVPMQTVTEIADIQKPVMNSVKISTDLNDGEIYEMEKAKDEWRDSKGYVHKATPAKYALTKKGLTKLMRAAGIKILSSRPVVPSTCQKCAEVNRSIGKPIRCGGCPNKDVKHEVRISVPQLTGENVTIVAHKEIAVDDVTAGMTEKQRAEFMKFRSEMCESKALNRALRTAMQIKSSYLIEEFGKPFVVAYLVPNLDNPTVREEAVKSMFGAANPARAATSKPSPALSSKEDSMAIEWKKNDLPTLAQKVADDASETCQNFIYAGIDVELSDGTQHFSLMPNDQTNIDSMFAAITLGASEYPYHPDGGKCVMYSAADIITLYSEYKSFVTKQTTYCNALRQWAKRETDPNVIGSIYYGCALPEDLEKEVGDILSAAQAQITAIINKLSA